MAVYMRNLFLNWYSRWRGYCIIPYLMFILFLWYGNNPVFFEKKFYLNEIFSLIGFFLFILNPIVYKKEDYIYNCVMAVLFIFFTYAVLSLMIYENFYGYLRHLVLVYSIFSFFLGMKFYHVLSNIDKWDLLFLSALFPSSQFYRTSYAVSLPWYISKYEKSFHWYSLVLIILIIVGVRFYYGGATPVAVALFLGILFVMNQKIKKLAAVCLMGAIVAFFVYMKPYLSLLLQDPYRIHDILHLNPLFTIDGNATTRFFLWSYLFHKIFLKNLLGIGLGTPLFPHDFLWEDMRIWIRNDPYLEYTLGAHNSFLTVLARFGIPGLLPFMVLYWKLITDFIKDRAKNRTSYLFFFYCSFFIATICAALNVVL